MFLSLCISLAYLTIGYIIISECSNQPEADIYFSPVDNLE